MRFTSGSVRISGAGGGNGGKQENRNKADRPGMMKKWMILLAIWGGVCAWCVSAMAEGKGTPEPRLQRTVTVPFPADFRGLSASSRDEILYRVIYKGYLERDARQIRKMGGLDNIRIPADFDFKGLKGLRLEAAQKLDAFRPATLGQASRISGVSPADIGVLSVFVKAAARQKGESPGE